MKKTTFERLKTRNFFICRYLSFYEQLNFVLSGIEHEKVLYPRGLSMEMAVANVRSCCCYFIVWCYYLCVWDFVVGLDCSIKSLASIQVLQ